MLRERNHLDTMITQTEQLDRDWRDNVELAQMGEDEGDNQIVADAEQALNELSDFRLELVDRFGTPPAEAARLLDLKELQLLAGTWQIGQIRLEDGFVVFGYIDPNRMKRLQKRLGTRLRIVDRISAYYVPTAEPTDGDGLLSELKLVLQPEAVPAYKPGD